MDDLGLACLSSVDNINEDSVNSDMYISLPSGKAGLYTNNVNIIIYKIFVWV